MMKSDKLQIATIGKAVGLWGELKLHLQSDFQEQFVEGSRFTLSNGDVVEVEKYNISKSLIKFRDYNIREDAAKLTNQKLYTTIDETRKRCDLKDGQYFWFDVIGSKVYDNEIFLGYVDEIERIAEVDYLVVQTSKELVKKEYSKRFYIPYIKVYIKEFNLKDKRVETVDGLLLLEAS